MGTTTRTLSHLAERLTAERNWWTKEAQRLSQDPFDRISVTLSIIAEARASAFGLALELVEQESR